MLRLAVTTRAETFERMRGRLSDRGIRVDHLPASGRLLSAGGPGVRDLEDLGNLEDLGTQGTLADAGDSAGRGAPDGDPGPPAPDAFDAGFVYPSRLMEGAALTAGVDLPWVNGRAAVATSRNKGGVLAALDAAGLPTPATVMVSNPADADAVRAAAEAVGYPLVVKPNSATRGVGIARVRDPDSLLGVTDYLDLIHDYRATGDKSYLLQEFLPEARDYRVMVIDGRAAGAVGRRLDDPAAAGRWKHNVHRGATAVGIDPPAEATRLAERAAAALDIRYVGVDLLESDGRLVVTETNARPTIDDAAKYDPDFHDRLARLIRDVAGE